MALISAFQTGNSYTAEGQRIAYAKRDDGFWQMTDYDRGITYVLNIEDYYEDVTPRDIYRAYLSVSIPEHGAVAWTDYDLEKQLYAAAKQLNINSVRFIEQVVEVA